MKNLLIMLFTLSSRFCFAQSDYVILENNTGKKIYYKNKNVILYDSIKNITTVNLYGSFKSRKLVGKWFDFDRNKFIEEHLISHCPIFIDENNIVLEIGIFEEEFHKVFTGAFDFEEFQKKYLTKYIREKSIVISNQVDETKKFCVYKIKMPFKFNKEKFFTSYHLIGKKKNNIYRMVIYNIDEINFDNFDTFLINTFNNN